MRLGRDAGWKLDSRSGAGTFGRCRVATPGTQGKECRLSPLPRPRAATMTSSPILGPPAFSVLRVSPGVSGEEVDLGHSLEVQKPGRALSPAPPGPQTHAQAGPGVRVPPDPTELLAVSRRLLGMDGAALWIMKYSQVSDSLRNNGDQSIPFQGVIFFLFTASVSC